MMGERASTTIRRAEQDIRVLIAEAATSGEYDVVSRLSGIARRLSELAEESGNTPTAVAEGPPPPPPAAATERIAPRPAPAPARKTSRRNGYPRFERSRDVLVKIGWSKKERSEYVHKAPKAGVDALARRVMEVGKGGGVFTTDDLLPVKLGSGDELPGYQAYICLAWLREIGAAEQRGREGYSVLGDDVMGTVNKAWESLPDSRR